MKSVSVYVFSFLALLICLASCKKDPKDIYEEEKSGVVLIRNNFYYEITLSDGTKLYFTGIGKNGIEGLTDDLNEVKKDPAALNGTGFFINESGEILTNRHVVAPEIDKLAVKQNINQIINNYTILIDSIQERLNGRYQEILNYANQNVYTDEYGNSYTTLQNAEIDSLREEVSELKDRYDEAEGIKQELRGQILSDRFEIKLHSL